jgi:hypothetical protein
MSDRKFGMNLRGQVDLNVKAKNPWDTDVLEPGATRTPAEMETNKTEQYENASGVGPKQPMGGEASGK